MSLPELPEPFALSVSVHEGDTPSKTYMECMLYQEHPNEKQRLYTADQMRAYALQAVEALRPVAMTPSEVTEAFDSELRASYTDFEAGVRTAEAHHHITQKEQSCTHGTPNISPPAHGVAERNAMPMQNAGSVEPEVPGSFIRADGSRSSFKGSGTKDDPFRADNLHDLDEGTRFRALEPFNFNRQKTET